MLLNRSAAMTISPSGSCERSTYSSPGAAPQCSSTPLRSSSGRVANHSRYFAAEMRIGLPSSCSAVSQSGSWAAGRDQGMDQRVAVLRRQARNCVRTVDGPRS